MTKDGRPSRITDIRFFHGNKFSYLKGHEEAVAFGRRIAWFLNGEGFSLGAYPALYLFFTPTISSGAIQVTDYGGDWWHRFTNVGVRPEFPNQLDASGLITHGTVAALKTIRPDLTTMIEHAEQMVTDHRENLRFLVKCRQTKQFTVDVSFNIASWPKPSHMFVSLTSRSDGTFLEAPPMALLFYDQAFDLAGTIRVSRTAVDILPNQSVGARLVAARHGDVHRMVTEFLPRKRPVFSKLVSEWVRLQAYPGSSCAPHNPALVAQSMGRWEAPRHAGSRSLRCVRRGISRRKLAAFARTRSNSIVGFTWVFGTQ